jgi:hypothetical protein
MKLVIITYSPYIMLIYNLLYKILELKIFVKHLKMSL